MLNYITSEREGNLYISDTEAIRIHLYINGKLSVLYDGNLDYLNGLLRGKDRLPVASSGGMGFAAINLL